MKPVKRSSIGYPVPLAKKLDALRDLLQRRGELSLTMRRNEFTLLLAERAADEWIERLRRDGTTVL